MFFRKLRRRLMGNHRFRTRGHSYEFPLNIPPSRKEVAMRRRQRLLRGMKWSAVSGLLLWSVTASGELWDKAFRASPAYAVGQFELSTNGAITVPQVVAVTGLRPDQNITDLDLGALRSQLLTLPQVREASVERRLPRHLAIRLEERRPCAWLACEKQGIRAYDSKGLLLDADHVVFPAGVVLNHYMNLPVIHCTDLSAVTQGRPVENGLVRSAVDLLERISKENWPQPMTVEKVHITNRFTLIAQMDTDALLTFHPDNLDRQIARLQAILRRVGPGAAGKVASVNLQLAKNVPVTFFGEEDLSPAPAPAAKPAPAKTRSAGSGGRRTAALSRNP